MGVVVFEYFVLIVVYCFIVDDKEYLIKVSVGKKWDLEIEKVLFYFDYNISGKKEVGIFEFYDYDVVLIKFKKKLNYDLIIRFICFFCIEGII